MSEPGSHTDTHGGPSEAIVKAGHEPDQVDVRPVAKFGAALTIFAILAYLGLWGLLKFFESERVKNQPRLAPMASEQERLPPEPRLQMAPGSKSELKSPDYEMVQQRQAEQDQLNSYGWANRNAGTVRIPIDEAMKLIVSRLPTQPTGAQAPSMAGGTQPGTQPGTGQGQPGIQLPTGSSSGRTAEPRKE